MFPPELPSVDGVGVTLQLDGAPTPFAHATVVARGVLYPALLCATREYVRLPAKPTACLSEHDAPLAQLDGEPSVPVTVQAYEVGLFVQLGVSVIVLPLVQLVIGELGQVQTGGFDALPPQVSTLLLKVALEQPLMVTWATTGAEVASSPQAAAKASPINDFVITFSLRWPGAIARAAE
jgi:hypothetical protein